VCPEGDILKIIHHKAALVSPTKCVGHGSTLQGVLWQIAWCSSVGNHDKFIFSGLNTCRQSHKQQEQEFRGYKFGDIH
jgi:hypothetical protein